MSFDVSADAYDRFMGRFSAPLAEQFAELAQAHPGDQVLDVGCGPGALTAQLVQRLGANAMSAIDPSTSFVTALRARFPEVDVRSGTAEQLPFPDDDFDLALAQLVVHFMADPVAGLRETGRVKRPGGVVAACVWDHAGGGGPLSAFWHVVHDIDPDARDESGLAGGREGHLAELCVAAGLPHIASSSLRVGVRFETFEDWWECLAGRRTGGCARDPTGRCETRTAPDPVRATAADGTVRDHRIGMVRTSPRLTSGRRDQPMD